MSILLVYFIIKNELFFSLNFIVHLIIYCVTTAIMNAPSFIKRIEWAIFQINQGIIIKYFFQIKSVLLKIFWIVMQASCFIDWPGTKSERRKILSVIFFVTSKSYSSWSHFWNKFWPDITHHDEEQDKKDYKEKTPQKVEKQWFVFFPFLHSEMFKFNFGYKYTTYI